MIQISKGSVHKHRFPVLQLAVIAAAEQRPVSGKAFAEKIASLTQDNWRVSPGQVYPLLRSMEQAKLLSCQITEAKGKGRRELEYTPTAKGKALLEKARKESTEHLNKMMARMIPLSTFVRFGEEDPELMRLLLDVHKIFNDKVWRVLGKGKAQREKFLLSLKKAIEKTE